MARVQYGAIITDIKGKIGGQVLQGGRSGGIMKNKGHVVQQRKGRMHTGDVTLERVQSNFSIVTKHWSSLTDAERNSWAALLGVWTFTDKFGNKYDGSKYQIFCAANINRITAGLSLLDTAPVYAAALDPEFSWSDFSLSGTWDRTNANNNAAGQMGVYKVSRPFHKSKPLSKVQTQIATFAAIPSPTTVNKKAEYLAYLGYTPPIGSLILVESWTFLDEYPEKQFVQQFVCEVVA